MYLFVTLAIIVIILYFFGKDLSQRWFAFFMKVVSSQKDPKYEVLKKDLFSSLHSQKSHDNELRKENKLKILEIGVGTGTNFEYYPDGTHLTVVDCNPHFSKYYNENRKKFTNIQSEEIVVCKAEEMYDVKDNSIDAVVVTLVLCSVTEMSAVLKQIYRVLAPGGRFYFVEHIVEFDEANSFRLSLQKLLTNSGLWPFLFEGCMLDRDIEQPIKDAGFSSIEADRLHAPMKPYFSVVSPHFIGFATK